MVGGGQSVRTQVTTLNKIIDVNNIKRIDFLKLDCEGSEYDILFNLKNKNFKIISKIALEYENLDKSKRNIIFLRKFLEQKGFDVFQKNNRNEKQGILYAINKIFQK
ncbi:FkbM family methyltransferase [Candidatus Pacearchaeota archaeon]|nr:FkbM family methyltransferase [Candidatus Pacearchaeota archaeon]